jgi:hypothetical protein
MASLSGASLRPGHGPGVGVRDAAVAGDRTWAISDTGQLLGYHDGRWSVPGDANTRLRSLLDMTRALGDGTVAGPDDQALSAGFNALALASSDEGFAVGGGGQIARFDGDRWAAESSPTNRTLVGVAAARDAAVAVGDHGTLLERRDGHWSPSAQAAALLDNADLTAVTTLRDGTVVAAAGGATIVRDHGSNRWKAAPIAPAGGTIRRLSGYRDRHGALHVVALVAGAGGPVLLDGEAAGWRPVDVPAGLGISDVHVDEGAHALWLGGVEGKEPVLVQAPLPASAGSPPAPPTAPEVTGNASGLIASGSISLNGDREVAVDHFQGGKS